MQDYDQVAFLRVSLDSFDLSGLPRFLSIVFHDASFSIPVPLPCAPNAKARDCTTPAPPRQQSYFQFDINSRSKYVSGSLSSFDFGTLCLGVANASFATTSEFFSILLSCVGVSRSCLLDLFCYNASIFFRLSLFLIFEIAISIFFWFEHYHHGWTHRQTTQPHR